MVKRGSARKARVFTVPTHLQPVEAPKPSTKSQGVQETVKIAAQEQHVEGIQLPFRDNETAYLVGALLDAKRAAEGERQAALAQGDTQLAATLANKAATLADMTTRVAQAITRRAKR